ncbi:DUF5937 family protein [Amycolatopsis sp. NPDC052450]|uniref:DUF5937 family protein n=1 Tax=Amycolatopsis sp. NPDC052450 TaxID=3363937 RepID=UPI0037C7FF23
MTGLHRAGRLADDDHCGELSNRHYAHDESPGSALMFRRRRSALLKVTVADTPAPLMELVLALMTLQRRDHRHVFGGWRRRTARGLPVRAEPLLQLLSPTGIGPLFLDPPSAGLEDGLSQVLATDRAVVEAELRRICAVDRPRTAWIRQLAAQDRHAWRILEHAVREAHRHILAAEWPRLQVAFYAEAAWRAHFLARHGLERTFTSLSAGLRWRDMSLEIDSADVDREVTLRGEGVVLLPSLLWAGRVLVAPQPAGPALVIYPGRHAASLARCRHGRRSSRSTAGRHASGHLACFDEAAHHDRTRAHSARLRARGIDASQDSA